MIQWPTKCPATEHMRLQESITDLNHKSGHTEGFKNAIRICDLRHMQNPNFKHIVEIYRPLSNFWCITAPHNEDLKCMFEKQHKWCKKQDNHSILMSNLRFLACELTKNLKTILQQNMGYRGQAWRCWHIAGPKHYFDSPDLGGIKTRRSFYLCKCKPRSLVQ